MIQKTSPYRHAIIYGVIVAAFPIIYYTILIVFDLLMEYYGDDPGGGFRMPTYFYIMPLFICLAIYRYKKSLGKVLKLKQAYIIGLGIAVTTSFLMISYHLLFTNVLAPSFHEKYYEIHGQQIYNELIACCDYTLEQFEHHRKVRLTYSNGEYFIDFILSTSIGFFTATVAGLIVCFPFRTH